MLSEKQIRDAKMLDSAKRAVALAGGNAEVRRLLAKNGMPISRAAISLWKRIPCNKVELLHHATMGRVSKHEMRPDVFRNEG